MFSLTLHDSFRESPASDPPYPQPFYPIYQCEIATRFAGSGTLSDVVIVVRYDTNSQSVSRTGSPI